MSALLLLIIGMAVVVGGVLVFRVHAFLALIVGALIVSFLTPRDAIYEQDLTREAIPILVVDNVSSGPIALAAGSDDGIVGGMVFVVVRTNPADRRAGPVARIQVEDVETSRSWARVLTAEPGFEIREDDLVVTPKTEASAASLASASSGSHLADGFGRTATGIGILIAMAAIIGKCLLDSGGAERVVLAIRKTLGEERTGAAFLGSGFIVAIPVFFDTVFYLLVPLAKAMAAKTGRHYTLYILTIVAGAAVAHSLIPPTPGPLFVASELGVDIGLMILGGLVVGSFALPFGYLFAHWADGRFDIPLRPSAELTEEDLRVMAARDEGGLPSLWLSLLPILLPVILIAGNTVFGLFAGSGDGAAGRWIGSVEAILSVIGDKNVALIIAAVVALTLLASRHGFDRLAVRKAVQVALASGGIIILITAAGGSFGHVLRLTGISNELKELIPATQLILLPAAFAMTTLVRVAQGSATVAMITSVGIFAPIAAAGGLPFHPLYLALAIGCGSTPYPWMNDSGFWIISTMSGFTEAETLKTASVAIALMGIAGIVATLAGAWFFPLV